MPGFRILTYNTHLFGDPLAIEGIKFPVFEDAVRAERIAERIVENGADIVGLTEVWDDNLAKKIVDAVNPAYPNSWRPPNGGIGLLLGNGLLVLTRATTTLDISIFESFSDLAGPDYFSYKGFAVFTSQPQGSAATLKGVLTHTQAAYPEDPYTSVRLDNFRQIASSVTPNQDLNFIFGDLNTIAEEGEQPTREYDSMLQILAKEDAYRTVFPDIESHPGLTFDVPANNLARKFNPDEPDAQQRLDYVLYCSEANAAPTAARVLTDWTFETGGRTWNLSDHYPLELTFDLEALASR